MFYELTQFIAIEGENVDNVFAEAKEAAQAEVIYVHYYELSSKGKVESDFEYWIYKSLRMEYDGVAAYVVYVDDARSTRWQFSSEDDPLERLKALADMKERTTS